MHEENPVIEYETPTVRELGSLRELTADCQGFGAEDGAAKGNAPFTFSQTDFGDPGLCGGP